MSYSHLAWHPLLLQLQVLSHGFLFPCVSHLCCSQIFPYAFLWFIAYTFTSFKSIAWGTLCRRKLSVGFGTGLEVTAAWTPGLSPGKAQRTRWCSGTKLWWVKYRKAKARCVLRWSWHVHVQLDFSELPGAPVGEINASWLFRMEIEKYWYVRVLRVLVCVWGLSKKPLSLGWSSSTWALCDCVLLSSTERRSKLDILLPLETPNKHPW